MVKTCDSGEEQPPLLYRQRVQMIFQDPFGSLNPVNRVGYHIARPLRRHGLATRGRSGKRFGSGERRPIPGSDFIDRFPTSYPADSVNGLRLPARSPESEPRASGRAHLDAGRVSPDGRANTTASLTRRARPDVSVDHSRPRISTTTRGSLCRALPRTGGGDGGHGSDY